MSGKEDKLENVANNHLTTYCAQGTQAALSAYQGAGGTSAQGATYVCMGGVAGALSIMAAMIGFESKGKDQKDFSGMSNESFLFAALLTVASNRVIAEQHSGTKDHYGIATEWSPATYMEAVENFVKITGKQPDGFVNPTMLAHARQFQETGNTEANKLLGALCANKKPL